MEKFINRMNRKYPQRGFARLVEIQKSENLYEDKIDLIKKEYGVTYSTAAKYMKEAKQYV